MPTPVSIERSREQERTAVSRRGMHASVFVKTNEPDRHATVWTRLSFVSSFVEVPGWSAPGGVFNTWIPGVNGSESVTDPGGVPTVLTTCATVELESSTP